SYLFLRYLPAFAQRMRWMADELEGSFGKRPVVTDTTEMCMSATIYDALDTAGFRGVVMDGRSWVMGWRESTHLYRSNEHLPLPLPPESKKRTRRSARETATPPSGGTYPLTR